MKITPQSVWLPPSTGTPNLPLISTGNGSGVKWGARPITNGTNGSANDAWPFSSNSSYPIYTTYVNSFASETISGFTKYVITVVIDTPNNNGTTTNSPNLMYLRIHDSVTGTNVINDSAIGTLYFAGPTAYSPGSYVWSQIYTASSNASRTLTSYVRVASGGATSQQVNGTIIGIS